MPLPNISKPQYPNVPALLGVPQLVRIALNQPPNYTQLVAQTTKQQALLSAAAMNPPSWGIFNLSAGLDPVVLPDSIYAFDQSQEWKTPDFVLQNGGFASYDKVTLPFELSVRLNKGGSLADRTQMLNAIDAIAGDTNLYAILTPEKTYLNCNIRRTELVRRSKEGAYFIEVDVFFRQINQVSAQYSISTADTTNAKSPAATPSVSLGNVQPSTNVPAAATAAAQTAITNTFN
jgi:hypothetical protein